MKKILYLLLALSFALTACEEEHNDAYLLQREDIIIMAPEAGFFAEVGKPFELQVKSVSDEGVSYAWFLGTTPIANTTVLADKRGIRHIALTRSQKKFALMGLIGLALLFYFGMILDITYDVSSVENLYNYRFCWEVPTP